MEDPPPSEYTTAVRCDNVCGPASDGIGVDGAWNHQSVCEGESQCGSIGACEFSVMDPILTYRRHCAIAAAGRRHQGVDLYA